MSDYNDNDDGDFVNDVLNVEDEDDDQDDVDVPYDIVDDDDDNINVHDDDECHNNSWYLLILMELKCS